MGEDALNGLAEKLLYFSLCLCLFVCLIPLYIFIIMFGLIYHLAVWCRLVRREPPSYVGRGR